MASVAKQDPVDVAIGERLHQWMWRNRVSQVSFAKLISVSQPSLGRKLRGDSAWSAGELHRTATALGVSVGWLFGQTEEEPARPKGLEPLTFWSGVCEHEGEPPERPKCGRCGRGLWDDEGIDGDLCEDCIAELTMCVRTDDLAVDDLALAA